LPFHWSTLLRSVTLIYGILCAALLVAFCIGWFDISTGCFNWDVYLILRCVDICFVMLLQVIRSSLLSVVVIWTKELLG
jgi:hypothetical protein